MPETEMHDEASLHDAGEWPDIDAQPDASDGGLDDADLADLPDGDVVAEEDLQ